MAKQQHENDGKHCLQETTAIMNLPTNMASSTTPDEDIMADLDEPPDDNHSPIRSKLNVMQNPFSKTAPALLQRKESLLTNALHTSDIGSPMEEHSTNNAFSRGLSCASTWSNNSTCSTAELTSDGGFTSPGTRTSSPSPPLPSSTFHDMVPAFNKKPFEQPVSIVHHDEENIGPLQKAPTSNPVEASLEANLGRKRCITFACGRKDNPKVAPKASPPKLVTVQPAEPSKRPCTIRFACPFKASTEAQADVTKPKIVRAASPAPRARQIRASPRASPRSHRDSDSTVRNESPIRVRKPPHAARARKLSVNSDLAKSEAFRFHEFASSEEEIDEWLQESTCHRSRLTISDTLKVENTLRQLGEEVEEEEALEDEQEAELDDDDDEMEDDLDDDDDEEDGDDANEDEEDEEESDVSDEGFQTDDEEGFAGSDDDSDAGSDYHWWAPSHSTAATSIEHLDIIRPTSRRSMTDSSSGSDDCATGPNKRQDKTPKRRKSRPVNIRVPSPELPDSTDFVCGTLDEDRPLEDAYMSCLERRRAAKHKITPQDIDPSFPTSDPELEEEDEDDEPENLASESDQHFMFHGQMDPHEDLELRGRRKDGIKKRSPAQSPKRLRSPPPFKRATHRSPPPRRLFGQSPKRMRSPAPTHLRSPPPTRRTSLLVSPKRPNLGAHFAALAERPPLTVTASLPRTSISARPSTPEPDDDDDTCGELPTRGAIDIKVGLENKRLRRKEKLYQKLHRRGCKDKEKRPAPGKGCEKMREMGLGLAAHKGKQRTSAFINQPTPDQKDMHMLSV